jgi:4-amino-4-deoxy-L-arabinose transferase-like glycosyltransferase
VANWQFPPILPFPHQGGRDPRTHPRRRFALKLGLMGVRAPITLKGKIQQINRAFLLLSLIVAISLALKLSMWRFVADTDPARFLHQPDSQSYLDSAHALWQMGRFAVSPDQPEQPSTFRTPGYPAYLAVLYGFSGQDDVTIVILSQVLLSLGTIILVFWLSKRLWNGTVAVMAASLLLFDLPSFTSSLVVMSETLFTFILTCAIVEMVYLLRPHTRRKGLCAVIAGTLLGLATLIRPVSYYLVIVV